MQVILFLSPSSTCKVDVFLLFRPHIRNLGLREFKEAARVTQCVQDTDGIQTPFCLTPGSTLLSIMPLWKWV